MRMVASLRAFWDLYPALLYGLACYVGATFALTAHLLILVPLCFILSAARKRLLLAVATMLSSYFFVAASCSFPPAGQNTFSGVVICAVEDIQHKLEYAKQQTVYRVKILAFRSGTEIFKNFSSKIRLSEAQGELLGGKIYSFPAILIRNKSGYMLRATGEKNEIVDECFSLVSWRAKAKRQLSCLLARVMPPGKERALLEGCITGSFQEPVLGDALWSFGLQHLTVVSGFHFSLVASIAALSFGFFLSWRKTIYVLFIIATAYLLFVGPTPSVLRAYTSVMLFQVAKLFRRNPTPLNSFGVSLLVVILYDPASVVELSFQLSFLAVFAILLLYPLLYSLLSANFTSFSLVTLLRQPCIDHAAYLLRSRYASSIALVLAVNFMVAPLLLYIFQILPISGVLYNCFFPLFVSVAMGSFLVSLLFMPFPSLAGWMFSLLFSYLEWILDLITYAPGVLRKAIIVDQLSLETIVCCIAVFSLIGILFHKHEFRTSDRHSMLQWI